MQLEHSANKNRPIKRCKEVQRMWIKQLRSFVKHIHTVVVISEVLLLSQHSLTTQGNTLQKYGSWKCLKKFILSTPKFSLCSLNKDRNFYRYMYSIWEWHGVWCLIVKVIQDVLADCANFRLNWWTFNTGQERSFWPQYDSLPLLYLIILDLEIVIQ